MKQYLLIIFMWFSSMFVSAQEHLEFKGVPIDGKVEMFVNELLKKGYTKDYEIDGSYILKGDFTDRDATIFVLGSKKTHTVWKVMVEFGKSKSWLSLKHDYEKYVSLFKQKYGTPSNHFEFFSKPYYEGDGYELQALRNEKCVYSTYFKSSKGIISIKLSKSECLSIIYEDGINVDIASQEKNSSNLNDI